MILNYKGMQHATKSHNPSRIPKKKFKKVLKRKAPYSSLPLPLPLPPSSPPSSRRCKRPKSHTIKPSQQKKNTLTLTPTAPSSPSHAPPKKSRINQSRFQKHEYGCEHDQIKHLNKTNQTHIMKAERGNEERNYQRRPGGSRNQHSSTPYQHPISAPHNGNPAPQSILTPKKKGIS